MNSLLVRNGSLLTNPENRPSQGPAQAMDLLVRGGRIAAIGSNIPAPTDIAAIDASGLTVTPGWIDIQLNGAFGLDFTEDPDSIWSAAKELPKLGTTSFLPTIITSPLKTIDRAIEVMKNRPPSESTGATPLGLHLEEPFLNPGKKGAHNPRYLQAPNRKIIHQWTRTNGVYLVTLAPELDEGFTVTRQLSAQGVVVSIGHSLATYEQALNAFKAGVQCGTHLFNAQTEINQRRPGLSVAILEKPEIYAGLIIDGVHVHLAMINLAWMSKGSRRFITVTDAISALGMPPGKYHLGDFEINVTETTVRLKDGTLAGSNETQQRSLRNLMAWTGCSLYDAIRTLTATPAELLNLPNKGRISIGADADLVLITPDLEIKATIAGGKVLFKDLYRKGSICPSTQRYSNSRTSCRTC